MDEKKFVEIDGKMWEATYPFCSGCPELIVGWSCGYEGNGCRFPEKRITRPRLMNTAYHALGAILGKDTSSSNGMQEIREKEIELFEQAKARTR